MTCAADDGDPSTAEAEDLRAVLEIFQGELLDDDAFRDLVLDIMDDVQLRFGRLEVGELTRRGKTSSWPVLWTYESTDRDEFLRQDRWFSSNYAPAFGRLLTPLVDGIKVQGPLYPAFTDRHAKVVYLGGQGLGHTPDSSNSVTTHVTEKFAKVDTILLVDNAEQPIQAAAQAVLRAVAASGNYGKLGIYEQAAPVPGTVNSAPALNFMKAVREIVRTAIEEQGGEMRSA